MDKFNRFRDKKKNEMNTLQHNINYLSFSQKWGRLNQWINVEFADQLFSSLKLNYILIRNKIFDALKMFREKYLVFRLFRSKNCSRRKAANE